MVQEPSEFFKVFAIETRVKIIELMKSMGPLGAKNIAELLGITPAAASQHLKILKQAGLVRSERKGYWIPYKINEEALEKCRQVLNEVCTCSCRGTVKMGDNLNSSSTEVLKTLKEFEKELQNEIEMVRQRINEIKNKHGKPEN